jgi:hypothetical protein
MLSHGGQSWHKTCAPHMADAPHTRSRAREVFALGLSLARARISVKLGLVFVVATTIGLSAIAATMAARGRYSAAALTSFSGELLAWGPGMLVLFAAALHALKHDAENGAIALVASRGVPLRAFVGARVLSLAALLAIATGVGTFVITCAAALASRSLALALASIQGGVAGIVHGVAFAAVMAPVALATVGARSRSGGYVALLLVLVVPEVARLLVRDLPREWTELMSIPSALATVRSALSPGRLDGLRAAGALLVIALVSLLAAAEAVRQAGNIERSVGEDRA